MPSFVVNRVPCWILTRGSRSYFMLPANREFLLGSVCCYRASCRLGSSAFACTSKLCPLSLSSRAFPLPSQVCPLPSELELKVELPSCPFSCVLHPVLLPSVLQEQICSPFCAPPSGHVLIQLTQSSTCSQTAPPSLPSCAPVLLLLHPKPLPCCAPPSRVAPPSLSTVVPSELVVRAEAPLVRCWPSELCCAEAAAAPISLVGLPSNMCCDLHARGKDLTRLLPSSPLQRSLVAPSRTLPAGAL
ncbi:hypothetical protein CRG98_029531 [Punica granatum]|uniref:Uncharacterized protein n=1 Tax=Punica granatum TaxID=22663 RepID=A0A2I0J219_PUNGR|nr:hypothetical protein CRG98_029531 [Punica granatum]